MPKFSNIFIQLAISLNLVFASYYLICKDNVVLNGSNNLKSFFVAFTSEYILALEIVKSLGKSQELTIYYTNYVYFGFILVQMGLSQYYPKLFDKFLKLNFAFTYAYIISVLLKDLNYLHILFCIVASIIGNYRYDITLNYMTVYCTNYVYSITLYEAIYILSLSFLKSDYLFIPTIIILFLFTFIPYAVFTIKTDTQLNDLKNKGDSKDLEYKELPMSDQALIMILLNIFKLFF